MKLSLSSSFNGGEICGERKWWRCGAKRYAWELGVWGGKNRQWIGWKTPQSGWNLERATLRLGFGCEEMWWMGKKRVNLWEILKEKRKGVKDLIKNGKIWGRRGWDWWWNGVEGGASRETKGAMGRHSMFGDGGHHNPLELRFPFPVAQTTAVVQATTRLSHRHCSLREAMRWRREAIASSWNLAAFFAGCRRHGCPLCDRCRLPCTLNSCASSPFVSLGASVWPSLLLLCLV